MWTCENRPKFNRPKLLYPSDLTDAAAIGFSRRDLSHQRTPEDPAGDEPGRGQAPRATIPTEQELEPGHNAVAIADAPPVSVRCS
jgi:hypothetical protein